MKKLNVIFGTLYALLIAANIFTIMKLYLVLS